MPSQPRLRQQLAMYQIQEEGCSRSYFEGRLALDLIPSTCSFRLVDTLCHIGSSTKSIPRLRAYFAAGTKSESPEMRMICVTRSRSANEAISRPIRISTPFCVMVSRISRSVKLSTVLLPAHRSFSTPGRSVYSPPLDSSSPLRKATLRFFTNASKNALIHRYWSLWARFTWRFVMGLKTTFVDGGQS